MEDLHDLTAGMINEFGFVTFFGNEPVFRTFEFNPELSVFGSLIHYLNGE